MRKLPIVRDSLWHDRWAAELLTAPLPEEPFATCDSCAMVPPPGHVVRHDEVWFDPAIKCCGYSPRLANFLVGAVLVDRAPSMRDGRRRMIERIDRRVGVSPAGIVPPAQYEKQYGPARDLFGRVHSLRCGFHSDKGACTIWQHRNAVCRTWYCKHARGATGQTFWSSLEALFGEVEMSLARFCVLELDIGSGALRDAFPRRENRASLPLSDMNGEVPDDEHDAKWGTWAGREQEFYAECAKLVAPLSWADVERLGGTRVALLARLAREAFARHDWLELPERLAVASFEVSPSAPKTTHVSTYSEYDGLALPNDLVAALREFDGRPTRDAVRRVAARHGLQLDDDMLRKLVDFGVLVAESGS